MNENVLSQSSTSSEEDERFFLNNMRPMTPLVLNPVGVTSCWDGLANESVFEVEMDPNQRLPTPEERMRQQAEAVAADIIAIDVTGDQYVISCDELLNLMLQVFHKTAYFILLEHRVLKSSAEKSAFSFRK